jgi:hypothetical protein
MKSRGSVNLIRRMCQGRHSGLAIKVRRDPSDIDFQLKLPVKQKGRHLDSSS